MKHGILVILSLLCFLNMLGARPVVYLSLDDCKRMADNNSIVVKNAELDIKAAKAQRQEALAEYFPSVSLMAAGFYALDPMIELGVKDILGKSDFTDNLQSYIDVVAPQLGINPLYSTLQRGLIASVSVMQPVYAGGRIVTGNKLAVLGVEAAVLQRKIAARTSDEDIEQLYWQVVTLEEKQKTLTGIHSMLDSVLTDVEMALSAGLVDNTDLLQVKLKMSELSSGEIALDNGIRLAKMNLFNTIGQEYSYIRRDNDSIPYIDDILFSDGIDSLDIPINYYVDENELVDSQYETRLLELAVKAKKLEKRMAVGETLPSVAVGASYGYANILDKGDLNGAVYAVVKVPVTDWGKTARKIERLDCQIEKTQNEHDFLKKQILLQIRQLWLNANTSWQQMSVAEEAVEMAEENFNRTLAYYRAGLVSTTELLQAQTELQQARERYIEYCVEYKKALQTYINRTRQ